MKKLAITIILSTLLTACMTSSVRMVYESKPESVTILHTNDIHSAFLPTTIKAKEPQGQNRELGGILALNYHVKKIHQEKENVLLLNAGDFMTGSPICDIEADGAMGGAMVKFFNYIGFEGLAPGNHEFDISVSNAQKLFELCEFPVFSANLFTADGKLFTREPYQIYRKGDLVVGVIGTIVDDLPDYLNKPQRDQVVAKPSAPIVDSLAKILDPLTDLIVVLSHNGLEADSLLAEKVSSQIDVIIGGHSHHRLENAIKVNRKLIIQAGSRLRDLGRLDLTVVADTVQSFTYQLIPLWTEGIEPDSVLNNEIKKYEQLIDQEFGRVIGELKTPWQRSGNSESNLGNFVADCMRQFSQADLAVINSGGIRQDLPAGPIKKLDIKNILPFNNSIIKFRATGKQVLDLIRVNAEAAATNSSGILQVSGLICEWKVENDGSISIIKATVGGEKIDPVRIYSGATVDFVLSNAEKYLGFMPTEATNLMIPLTDVVMKIIEEQKVINSIVEGRMVGKK